MKVHDSIHGKAKREIFGTEGNERHQTEPVFTKNIFDDV